MELAGVLGLARDRYKPGLRPSTSSRGGQPDRGLGREYGQNHKYAVDRTEALWSMLRAAIAMIRGGQERFRAVADPFGGGPFLYRPRDGEFELQSALQFDEQPPVILVVGGSPSPSALPRP